MIYQEFDIKEKGSLEGAKLTVYIQEYAETLNIKERPLILICPEVHTPTLRTERQNP